MGNQSQPNKLLQETIEKAKMAIHEYETAKAGFASIDQVVAFIVCCQDVYLTFDLDAAGNVANPQHCMPHLARRFTFAQASQLAAVVRNGNDCQGEVVHVTLAVEAALDAQRSVLELLSAFGAGVGNTSKAM
jgi:hypothetical protein